MSKRESQSGTSVFAPSENSPIEEVDTYYTDPTALKLQRSRPSFYLAVLLDIRVRPIDTTSQSAVGHIKSYWQNRTLSVEKVFSVHYRW